MKLFTFPSWLSYTMYIMKAVRSYMLPAIALLVAAANGYGQQQSAPYGDYPHWNSAYGICRENFGHRDAEVAIERYFASRGLRAANMRHKDRFIEADIYKDNRLYDRILFDRKTGRIRSIY